MKRTTAVAALACVLWASIFGCSSDDGATDAAPPKPVCTAGAYVFCRCADTQEGTKLCKSDGLGFEACSRGENLPCGEAPVPDSGTPDTYVPPKLLADRCTGQNVTLLANADVKVDADTTTAADDFAGPDGQGCSGGKGAPDLVYALTAPASGKLTATVTPSSGYAPMMYLRTACEDAATQVACDQNHPAGQAATLNENILKGKTYFLVVDGSAGPSQAGAFSLSLRLAPQSFCGDGVVDNGEACDDANKVEGDGCGNDCRSIAGNPDSAKSCPGQPVHIWSATAVTGSGTTTGLPNTWANPNNTCDATGTNVSKDHVYQVVTHRAGTLTVKTTGADFSELLSARSVCATASTQIACKNDVGGTTAPFDETLSFPVTAESTYYVSVSGALGTKPDGNYTVSFQVP